MTTRSFNTTNTLCLYSEINKYELSNDEWYLNGKKYWSEVPATVDGVLGGYGFLSEVDIYESTKFIERLFYMQNAPKNTHALDCGAGIGRITKHLLSKFFNKIDLIEQNCTFIDTFKNNLKQNTRLSSKIDKMICTGLQSFIPTKNYYDVIWIQWVSGHLTDSDFIRFLKDCGKGLRENGLIIVKENTLPTGKFEIDEKDFSITRSMYLLKDIFQKSNLQSILIYKQKDFPQNLYPVFMFALKYEKIF